MPPQDSRPTLTLLVIWPQTGTERHEVHVDVRIEPPLNERTQAIVEPESIDDVVAGGRDIDGNVLWDRPTLEKTLRGWTLQAAPDSRVAAQIVSTRLERLLELLEVKPPVPDPIEVKLP